MTEAGSSAAVRHLVAWGLATGPTEPISLDGQHGLASAASFHRVAGAVVAAIESGGAYDVPVAVLDELRARHLDQLRRDLAVEADLVAVVRRLQAAGVDHRVLKGGATAHLDHADSAHRSASDVDLLVRSQELAAAQAAVAELVDAAATTPDRRRRWTERYGKDRTLALRSGGSLDLHRAAAPGYHAMVDDHDWFGDVERMSIGGGTIDALALRDRFVHALAHAGYADELRLNSARDVPLLLDRLGNDWERAVGRHPRWAGLLARGVERTWRLLPLGDHPITAWASHVDRTRRERIALRTLDLAGSRAHWGAITVLAPWRWPGFVGPLLLPSAAYLRHERRSALGRLRTTFSRVLLRR